jgi:predicted DNA-binding transcriptional regulator AlpA
MSEEILQQILDELRKPEIPQNWQFWTTKEIAKALGYTEAVTRDRLVHTPGFPKPYRINGGKPRWKAKEVITWMEQQRAA